MVLYLDEVCGSDVKASFLFYDTLIGTVQKSY